MLIEEWGPSKLASIQGGMSMINNVLTFIAFGGFLLGLFFNSSIPPRLLEVSAIN